jgi:pantothenate kinase
VAACVLDLGLARWPGLRQMFSSPRLRDWFYHRARHGTAGDFSGLVRPEQKCIVIGDAARPGKSKEAIASAFAAALQGKPVGGRAQ